MNQAIRTIDLSEPHAKLHVLRPIEDRVHQPKLVERIAIQTQDGLQLIRLKEITHIQAESNYSMIHLCSGERHLISKSLKQFQARLEGHQFIRTHQSYLVNLTHVVGLKSKDSPIVLLGCGRTIPVSRRNHATIKNYLLTQYSI